jgi:hypothetical protein
MAECQKNSVIRDKAKSFCFSLESGYYDDKTFSFDMLFKSILVSISEFGAEEGEVKNHLDNESLLTENWEILAKSFSGDSTLFEVGCFLYYLIDMWLRESNPKINVSTFFDTLLNKYVKLFNKIFEHIDSRDLYKQRYSKYRAVEEESGSFDDYYFWIEQLLFLTENNVQPKEHNFERITIVPFTYSLWIKTFFHAWYMGFVPVTFKSIQQFIKQYENR